tara:strand:+ start:727 stop:2517 length:1791 start_codon:yes stop_codon:yes gene_type:complete
MNRHGKARTKPSNRPIISPSLLGAGSASAKKRPRTPSPVAMPPPMALGQHVVHLQRSPPLWVSREQHPLNKGRPLWCMTGYPNKRYKRSDRITPIVDSMSALSAETGWRMFQTQRETEAAAAEAAAEAEAARPKVIHATNSNACRGCGARLNAHSTTADGDSLACEKCGVVGAPVMHSLHREKNCGEDEDKTTRAERYAPPPSDRFAQKAPSVAEARQQREREARGVNFGRRARDKDKHGWVAERVARKTAQAERNRQEMNPKDQTKEIQILHKLEEGLDCIEPVDDRVKHYCRMQTYMAWHAAVRHLGCCLNTEGGSACQLNIRAKGAPIIAESALLCALQNLHKGVHTLEGVEPSHVKALNEKYQARINGAGVVSAAQRAVRTQVARLMAHASADDDAPIPPCGAVPPSPAPSATASAASASSAAGPADDMADVHNYLDGLHREASTETALCDDAAAPSPGHIAEAANGPHREVLEKLQVFVKRLQNVLPASRAPSVATAVRLLADARFGRAVCDAYAADARLSALAMQPFALVVVEAVARRVALGVARLPRRILQSLGASQEGVAAAVDAVDPLLPAKVAVPETPCVADDDRF